MLHTFYDQPIAMDTRSTLQNRLAVEFDDADFARAVVRRLGDETVAAVSSICGDSIATSPSLSFRPPEMSGDEIDAVVAFSYGYRLAPGTSVRAGDVPPMDAITPGPINALLAGAVAAFVAIRPMPVLAQWEIAQILDGFGTPGVVSIEPDVGEDGSTTYLSTAGVTDKGLALAAAEGFRPQRVGVIAHLDHAPRCVATARARGLDAGVITGVDLTAMYDPLSGQRWTRSRTTWITTDLYARTRLADSTDWNPPA